MRVRHWTGRILAELQDGGTPWFCTFTYEGGYDNPNAYWLDYRDIQLTFKKLRKAGFKFRYVIVGEYGSEKDRAHWHAVIIWHGSEPVGQFDTEQYTWPFWNKGYSYIERPRNLQATVAYLLKYLLKDPNAKMRYSKMPALGENYLLEYARRHAREGLSLFPKQATFTVPGNQNENGKPFFYYIDRHSTLYQKMMRAYLLEWATSRPDQRLPLNDNMIEYIEDLLQGPVSREDAMTEYLIAQYQIDHPERVANEFTVHALFNGFIAIQWPGYTMLEKYREGKRIWRKALEGENPDHRELTPEKRQRLEFEIKTSPPMCQKVFESDLPSEAIRRQVQSAENFRTLQKLSHLQNSRPPVTNLTRGGPGDPARKPPQS